MILAAIIENLPFMNIIVPICLTIGLVLCFAESLIPGFGVCGICGIVLLVGGTVYFALGVKELFWVLILVAGLICGLVLIFVVFVRSAKKGRLSKTPFFENKTNLPVDYDKSAVASNSKYLGKTATIISDCRPVGRARIENEEIEVTARTNFIKSGTTVKVIEVLDNEIIVDVIDAKKEEV